MARLTGPDEACRVVYLTSGTHNGQARAQGMSAPIYSDEALTTLADIRSAAGGVVAGSELTVDAYSRIPLFQYPDGVDTVYTSINGGPAVPLYARTDDRLDALAAAQSAHAADTTDVHGIADTSALETTAGAQAKADAAQTAAVGAAAALAIVFGA